MTAQKKLKHLKAASQQYTGIGAKKRSRRKAEKGPIELQKIEAISLTDGRREHQGQVKAEQDEIGTDQLSSEASQSARPNAETDESVLIPLGEVGEERRITFILRVSIDRQAQPIRIEIEHAQSCKKQSFATLELQRLVTFLKACVTSSLSSEPTIPAPPSLAISKAIPPKPLGSASSLFISNVQLVHIEAPSSASFVFNPTNPFTVTLRFQLQGVHARALAALESPYEMRVFANELPSGKSKLLANFRGNLAYDVLDYTAQANIPGLYPGTYRLLTLVALQAPINLLAHHEGPIIEVSDYTTTIHPAQGH
jgi:hypothetical protein